MKVVFVKIAMKQRLCWCKKKSIKKYIYRRAVIYFYLKKGVKYNNIFDCIYINDQRIYFDKMKVPYYFNIKFLYS